MNAYSVGAHRHVGAAQVHPGAGVPVLHSVLFHVHRDVGVPAENALSSALFCIAERALPDLRGQAQPSCVETVQVAGKPFVLRIKLLQPQINELSEVAQLDVLDDKSVELMPMDGQVALSQVFPLVLLVYANAYQVRHHFRQSQVVVAFHPNHFNVVLGVRKLADIAQELPVLLGQPAEVQVGKDVTQQDQPAELNRLQKLHSISSPADFGPK